ncbi:hypothetical protein [uncultured Erythrobacter sp.]|nr:hypothetical protein [uncultured Erythrobacter sp.]
MPVLSKFRADDIEQPTAAFVKNASRIAPITEIEVDRRILSRD